MTVKALRWTAQTFAVLSLLAVPASASLVSVTGGFTTFSGVVVGTNLASINGNVVCPDAGCNLPSGVANVAFAAPQQVLDFSVFFNTPNQLAFTPAAAQDVPLPGAQFLLGTIGFTNGLWSGNADFGFHLQSVSPSNALFDGHPMDIIFRMRLTSPNLTTNTPQQNADFIELINPATGLALVDPLNGLPLVTLRVYELADSPTGTNFGSADLYGAIGSLFATTLANPTGALFLDSSHSLAPTPAGAVPEPSSLLLIGGTLAGLAIRFRRG